MWKSFLRLLARMGLQAATTTAAEQMAEGPVTAGNVLKPAAESAAAAAARIALGQASEALNKTVATKPVLRPPQPPPRSAPKKK